MHERARFARIRRALWNPDTGAVFLLTAFPFVYFWQVTIAQAVWFTRDIAQIYYPFGVELSRALAQGRLPLWSPGILAGFPLVAEGHVSAFYPVYLLLFRVLPAHFALSYGMLLHLAWAGIGMYACVRTMGLQPASALLAGLAFSFNGYTLEKLYHTPILITSAWLPWLICLQYRFRAARAARRASAGVWLFLTAFAFALQLVAGFPQTVLLSAIAFVSFGLFEELAQPQRLSVSHDSTARESPGAAGWGQLLPHLVQASLWTALPIVIGIGIAAIQVVPTLELINWSVRSQSQSASFLTEYSLPPAFLSQFVLPYSQGEPIEHTNEYWGYFGLAPFAFALLAPFLRRDPRTFFTALFALAALALALGNLNPAYALIERLPVFSLFRTPARYILLFLFAATLLTAIGFQELTHRLSPAPPRRTSVGIAVTFGALAVVAIGLAQQQPLEVWLQVWQFLPAVLAMVLLAALVSAWKRRWQPASFKAFIIGLTIVDLTWYAPPFLHTLASLTPPAYVESVPRSVPLIQNGRTLTDLSVFPTLPALRGSLFPNTALVYDKASIQANSPLVYARHDAFLSNLSPQMLNLLNGLYFLLPLEPRFTDRTSTPSKTLALDILENEIRIPPTAAKAVLVSSYTEPSEDLAAGVPVAQVTVGFDDGATRTFPLRFGIETDSWDYDRAKASGQVNRDRATVAHDLVGFVRSFGRTFQAHTYRAQYPLELGASNVVSITIHSLVPNGRLNIEGVSLVDERGDETSLAASTHKDSFQLAYMSDTVAVWENRDALPRAFIVHNAQVLDDAATLAQMQSPDWRPQQTVLLDEGQPLPQPVSRGPAQDAVSMIREAPERLELTANTNQTGYLVLADSWYPGWRVSVDNRPAALYRGDLIVRAVPLEPGEHTVVFEFDPFSVRLGAVLSLASVFVALGGIVTFRRMGV